VAGPDGSLYYTEDAAVWKISPRGEITTVAADVSVSGCASIPGMEKADGPYLRGVDVDSHGSVYAAASGCGAVLKITADKTVTTVLRSSSPWSPTGVTVYGDDLYVLEYLHTVGDDRREWVPRVRKMSSDGRIDTVATIDRRQ
jgi:sugar lactone lactonase YvrE